ncbi:hypothetical protein NDU88_004475 [Pleurodeles waltl]|uniref:Uncharacterized protein n=1 Tax=Pleurodeles waltl TaxID=8319 RepID=A0AAV7L0F3_PLEWA|nr:hypothetical protein NDU88_004475 [Pleurodeles waltl]
MRQQYACSSLKDATAFRTKDATAFRTKVLKETYTLNKILAMARLQTRATVHTIQMDWRVLTMKQAHRMAGGHNKCDKPSLPLRRNVRIPATAAAWNTHMLTCPAMGHKYRKCNCDNHFTSVCMNGNSKAERSRPARTHAAESPHAQHVEAQNNSSSADSDATSERGTNERLYLPNTSTHNQTFPTSRQTPNTKDSNGGDPHRKSLHAICT